MVPPPPAASVVVPPTILLSAYSTGAKYTRHLDCYGDDNHRRLTLILYATCADTWCADADGGALRIDERDCASAVDIAPTSGTLAIFESHRVWHEVLPARRLRFAITLWVWGAATAEGDPPRAPPSPRRKARDGALVAKVEDAGGRTRYRWTGA